MKRKLFGIGMVGLLLMTACAGKKENIQTTESAIETSAQAESGTEEAESTTASVESESVGMANPFREFASLEEANAYAGVTLALPETYIDGARISAMADYMVELVYTEGETEYTFRTSKPADEDISGDFNTYTYEDILNIGDTSVIIKGEGEDIFVAIWSIGDQSYSLSISNGISKQEMQNLLTEVIAANK